MENRTLKEFYKRNKFFTYSFGITLLGNFLFSLIFVYYFHFSDYLIIGQFWVETSCIFTAAYTCWFWFGSGKKDENNERVKPIGILILDDIHENKTVTIVKVVFATFILGILIPLANHYIPIIWDEISIALSIFANIILMILTFCLFIWIDWNIAKGADSEDFRQALKNSDFPCLIAFFVLAIYYIIFWGKSMELFFYGAIAFQMLYSNIISANIGITDSVEQNE